MAKTVFLVLGNGFTIDFLSFLGKRDVIDVTNLFRYGAHVPWPENGEPGFLSVKRCPNLWHLGARPTMEASEAMALIEDIITCVNVYASVSSDQLSQIADGKNKIYLYAYRELVRYLRHLFVYYDKKIPSIGKEILEWNWAKYFINLHNNPEVESVRIVTLSYDVWLERTLNALSIPFKVWGFKGNEEKFLLLKPHGSISFCHKKEDKDKRSFTISYSKELVSGILQDYDLRYTDLDGNFPTDPMIPPAGESGKLSYNTWARQIKSEADALVTQLGAGDRMILSGISYWHVDRAEIDQLLVNAKRDVDVIMINPSPSRTMNAVLTSLFENYIFLSNTEALAELDK
ncbi:hypothetical protein GAY33_21905 [Azospirillum brasilense]|uniref:hypothetical protein n=1 Tax=Azospirillum argentinense TaxID=2970906 RepID=UPI00190EA1D8|nr:hypothetical protein [Azospirillum argentinense]MBK3801832.1 hypothetical protein [Azospirillum argentinense]